MPSLPGLVLVPVLILASTALADPVLIDFETLPDGTVPEEFDPATAPLLVHCAAGTNRTGLAVGMYRIHQQGWTVAQVLAEMRQYGFEDLPKHENLRQALAT